MRVSYDLMLTIFLYVPCCVHSSPKRGRFRSGLWRGEEAAPAPVEYRSAVPGGLLKAAWRTGSTPSGEKAKPPCPGAKTKVALPRACELARPGLRRGRVRERLKARRRRAFPHGPAEGDGERRSGDKSFRLCGRWVFVRAGRRGNPVGRTGWNTCPGRRTLRPKGMERPASRRQEGQPSPVGSVGNTPRCRSEPRAGEQDGSAQNRRARSARVVTHRLYGSTARRSAPPRLHLPHTPGESRGIAEACQYDRTERVAAGARACQYPREYLDRNELLACSRDAADTAVTTAARTAPCARAITSSSSTARATSSAPITRCRR